MELINELEEEINSNFENTEVCTLTYLDPGRYLNNDSDFICWAKEILKNGGEVIYEADW